MLSEESLLELFTLIFRQIVGQSLRLRGMLEILKRLKSLCYNSLEKACLSLLAPRLYAQIVGSTDLTKYINYMRKKFGAVERVIFLR